MKMIFYIAVIAAALWAGWFFHPGISKEMSARIEARKAEAEKEAASARNQAANDDRVDGRGQSKAGALLASIAGQQSDPANPAANTPPPTTSGTPATPDKPVTPAPVATVDEIDARYPMPVFRTIEEITKEWSAIPSRAFPRKVKTKVPLTFDVPAGKAELAAGSEAWAGGMVAGMLIVMREKEDTSRIQVPLANTDLKEKMTDLYERYKEYHRNRVIKQRERARALKARSNGASEEQMKLAGSKPEVRAGGVIPIMMESIQSGKLTELKLGNITSWGGLDFEEVDGTVYWTGTLQCTVENALFGPQPTEVMALMKDNKVVKWIYSGSREPVQ
jgi:hypothetical protein